MLFNFFTAAPQTGTTRIINDNSKKKGPNKLNNKGITFIDLILLVELSSLQLSIMGVGDWKPSKHSTWITFIIAATLFQIPNNILLFCKKKSGDE